MSLLYKSDWEMTKEHFLAWWSHEDFGRCALAVTAPKSGIPFVTAPPFPENVEDRWLDYEYLSKINSFYMSRTYYGGEAVPIWNPGNPGWDSIPAFLGCHVDLQEETGWISPIIEEGDLPDHQYQDIILDPNNHWWSFAKEMVAFAVKEAKDKSLPAILAISGCGDALASLRSTNKLLFDVIDCPGYVQAFDKHLIEIWQTVHSSLFDIIKEGAEGSICWFTLWSPGRFYALHNDFSYMISPKMFRDIFLPNLEIQTKYLDHSVYHVDGIGAFAHVDALCELPRLQALQILPGAGKPSPLDYMDILKKVQAAGKNLHISIPANEVKTALAELSSRGLFIQTTCKTEEEAKDLLKMAEIWSVDRQMISR